MNILKSITSKVKQMVTPAPTVEEIHREVYSIHSVLLKESEEIAKEVIEDNERLLTAKGILELGFHQAKNIGDPIRAANKIETLKTYQHEYPNYKFIDKESIVKICEKYCLYLCDVRDFIAEIPFKNQKEIMAFRVKEKHLLNYDRFDHPHWMFRGELTPEQKTSYSNMVIKYEQDIINADQSENLMGCFGLKIIAPESQIDMRNKKKIGFQIVAEDPIILQPVKEGFLIVTAWGEEAKDESVVNQKMN